MLTTIASDGRCVCVSRLRREAISDFLVMLPQEDSSYPLFQSVEIGRSALICMIVSLTSSNTCVYYGNWIQLCLIALSEDNIFVTYAALLQHM